MSGQRFRSTFVTYVVVISLCLANRVIKMQDYNQNQGRILINKAGQVQRISYSSKLGKDYENWYFRAPVPLKTKNTSEELKQSRLKRSIHKEKIPRFSITNESPYSSIVYIAVGCIGTLISPIHVLTAAHCVHDGRKRREGVLMNPLKVGLIRRNGKQHKIRVKKIFVSKEIKPNTESRFAYDYAVLQLFRPHRRPYLKVKAPKKTVRTLTFHVLERERNRRVLAMYRYSHCPVFSREGYNFYKILAKNCPSSPGNSGSAVFSSLDGEHSVIGLLSAMAKYKSHSGGHYYVTVVLKMTDNDVAKIKRWVLNTS